jgi:dihydroflavonol-4-reductase
MPMTLGAAHGIRVVSLSSTPFLDHRTTLTEESPVAENWSDDPYTITKGAAYVEAKRRVAEDHADIVIVIPGGTFGPGLSLSRALGRTSFNRSLRGAINGKVGQYVTYPVPWVFSEDVASFCVAALRIGSSGRTYLAFGAEDAQSTASWLNVACEVAGVGHRVAEMQIDPKAPKTLLSMGPH